MEQKTLKIAEVMDSFYPTIDGPTNVVTYYAKNINKREDGACQVLVPKADPKLHYKDEQPFEVLRCKSAKMVDGYRTPMPDIDKDFKSRIKDEHFDLYHAHSPFSMGWFALKQGKKQNVPVVATLHTKFKIDFEREFHGFKPMVWVAMKYIMHVFNKADAVWTVNNASCAVLREYGYKGDITVVRNGTDMKYPENASELIQRVNELNGLENQENVMIFVGRIAMYKNLRLMAEALKLLKDQNFNYKMIIVGGGFDEDKFREVVHELDLDDRFIFTGRVSDRELLQGYYLRSDLFLFPSTFDTSSLVPIEAAANKLPVLLIRNSDTAEGITDDFDGFLSDENTSAFAERIKQIFSDKEKLKQVGEQAHISVYRSWEMVADEAFEKYAEVISSYNEKHKKNA